MIVACMSALWFAFAAATVADANLSAYEIDGEHSHVTWAVDRFGFTRTLGSFTEISGQLQFDPAHPVSGSVQARIALSGLRSDLAEREDIVRGPHWLDAEAHPVIEFHSVELQSAAAPARDGFVMDGLMTLNGVQAPLQMTVIVNKVGADPVSGKQAAGFSASGSFRRSDFGIRTALGPIGDEVTFQIELLAIASAPVEPQPPRND
jgi:polyisoprenoid-binding protein YceI